MTQAGLTKWLLSALKRKKRVYLCVRQKVVASFAVIRICRSHFGSND